MKKTKYVAASCEHEAWLRFQAKLYEDSREDCAMSAEEMTADDKCNEKCIYLVYEITVGVKEL